MDKTLQWAIAKILDRLHPNFHGTITLFFQAGKLQTVKTEETDKPPAALV